MNDLGVSLQRTAFALVAGTQTPRFCSHITVNIIFRLYATASGGSPLWEEQWTGANSVQVSDGLFNMMLGSLTPIPQTVITGNSNLFLGIMVGTDSEMNPCVQLGSVPVATQTLTVLDGSITMAKDIRSITCPIFLQK